MDFKHGDLTWNHADSTENLRFKGDVEEMVIFQGDRSKNLAKWDFTHFC